MTTTDGRPRGRPRTMSREDRRDRVLAAAMVRFAAHGREATLDDIAAEAGVAKGSVYEVAASKDALYEAAVRMATDRLVAAERRAADAAQGEAPVVRVQRRIEAAVDLAVVAPDVFALLAQARQDPSPAIQAVVDEGRAALEADILERLIEVGVPDAVGPVVAAGLRAMVEAGIRAGVTTGVDPAIIAPLLARMVVATSSLVPAHPEEPLP